MGQAKELASGPETMVQVTLHVSAPAGAGTKAQAKLLLSMPGSSTAALERLLVHTAGSSLVARETLLESIDRNLSVAQETLLESTAHSWKAVVMETQHGIDPDSVLVVLATSLYTDHGTV